MPAAGRVFSAGARSDGGILQRGESAFAFLNRSSWSALAKVRDLVEEWAGRFPASERVDLVRRLQSKDDEQHAAAFWELYLHEVLTRAGWHLEPFLAANGAKIDFSCQRGGSRFLLEATTAGISVQRRVEQARLQALLKGIEGLDVSDFALDVTINSVGPESPPAGPLKAELMAWVATLDHRSVVNDYATTAKVGMGVLPMTRWLKGGWDLEFTILPITPGTGALPNSRVIGAEGDGRGAWIDSSHLVDRLETKEGRYGSLELPFVIAVLDLGEHPPHRSIQADALYGTLPGGPLMVTQRLSEGFWKSHGVAHNRSHVSAVVTAWDLSPRRVGDSFPVTWVNPWATRPVPSSLPWAELGLDNDIHQPATELRPRDDIRQLLGLPPDWPGPR